MIKIKKYFCFIGSFLLITLHSFCFEINDLKFGEEIEKGQKKSKEYILVNNSTYSKIYRLETEKKEKNIKITPKLINLKGMESKKFKIEVIGDKPKGNYKYFLVIREVKKEKKKNSISLNKTVRIQQDYSIK